MQDHISRLTGSGHLSEMVQVRLDLLHVYPSPDGCDIGLHELAVETAVREVLSVTGRDSVTSQLLPAVADIAAAELACAILLGQGADGSVSSRTDGDLTVRYIEGTSAMERKAAEIERLRERGRREALRYRKVRW